MITPRRTFLKSGAMVALFAGVCAGSADLAFPQQAAPKAPGANHPIPYETKLDPVFYFTRATFEPHLNTEFRVVAGRTSTAMKLVEIAACGPRGVRDGAEGECFTLLFRASEPLAKIRTIHEVEHDALKKFSMFFSPVKKNSDPEGIYYEAVINRRVK